MCMLLFFLGFFKEEKLLLKVLKKQTGIKPNATERSF